MRGTLTADSRRPAFHLSLGEANLISMTVDGAQRTAATHTSTQARRTRGRRTMRRHTPDSRTALRVHVLGRERISPSITRVTLGGGDLARFEPQGFDQWFRLFLPAPGGALDGVPRTLTTASYARFMLLPAATRPTLRNYTVRGYRADGPHGPELDIDFVIHGSADDAHAGPASTWAQSCAPGSPVAIIDQGALFEAPADRHLVLVADETALPAVAGILRSVPRDTRGVAVIEIPDAADRQDLNAPAGVEVRWVTRQDAHDVPGRAALAAAQALPLPQGPLYAWVAGESALATGMRRHWVAAGVPKGDISFCGYWKAGDAH